MVDVIMVEITMAPFMVMVRVMVMVTVTVKVIVMSWSCQVLVGPKDIKAGPTGGKEGPMVYSW